MKRTCKGQYNNNEQKLRKNPKVRNEIVLPQSKKKREIGAKPVVVRLIPRKACFSMSQKGSCKEENLSRNR